MLRDDSYDRCSRLEIYGSESDWADRKNTQDTFTIELCNITHLADYCESRSFANAFSIVRKIQPAVVIGGECELEKQQWVVAIKLLAGKLKGETPRRSVGSAPVNLRPWNKDFELPPRVDRDSLSSSPSPSPPPIRNDVFTWLSTPRLSGRLN